VNAAGNSGHIVFFSREKFIENEIGARYKLKSRSTHSGISDWLFADFNLENAAAAAAFARSQNIDWPIIEAAFNKFKGLPGRMEFVRKTPFAVVIDYAHTPDSLEKVYKTLSGANLKLKVKRSKLICVLGSAGGGRDRWKRPVMGKIAAEYCREIILTNEDPYDEDPDKILEDIEGGFAGMVNYRKILDRKEAIWAALNSAEKGDTVIITGKGSEAWIHVADGNKIPWDEKKIVINLLNAKGRH
jgi:UDP-N-acetylmuramyl tripeptide synthase